MRIKTAYPITMDLINEDILEDNITCSRASISHISTDTRELCAQDLYFALSGSRFDGEDFITDATYRGALSVGRSEGASIRVRDPGQTLLELAHRYKRAFFQKPTVAITGSVGKTTVKDLTASILSKKYKVHATKGNLNNEIGLPMTILSAAADTDAMILEMGMNHRGEIRRLSLCAEPSLSVITCIGTAHIGNLGSRDAIAEAKSEILDGMVQKSVLIPHGEELLTNLPGARTVSTTDPSADHFLEIISKGRDTVTVRYFSERIKTDVICLPSPGVHFPTCLAFAISVADSMDLSREDIESALGDLNYGGRLIVLPQLTILNDCYNASCESVRSALGSLSYYGKRSALLGNMLELGEFTADMHLDIGRAAAECRLEYLYLIGEFSEYIKEGAVLGGMSPDRILINADSSRPDISAEQIISTANGETILFKASRGMHLETVINIIKDYFD
ncbi:MAG: UDP-N-acetylmuramoyl-tripeptide--D-alanyl-D-alanine ligase [Ruminococcaceae bacterium]|nr:UDP-N-acetylmuramoyl-tripeptide--D-alanyl-D-alanine ligase [Oscillospiraceae bacterium]